MIKYFSLRHLRQFRVLVLFVCVFTTATVKDELLSVLAAVSSLHATVTTTVYQCHSGALLSLFFVFVSPFQYQWG